MADNLIKLNVSQNQEVQRMVIAAILQADRPIHSGVISAAGFFEIKLSLFPVVHNIINGSC